MKLRLFRLTLLLIAIASTGMLLRATRAAQPSTIDAVLESPVIPASVLKVLALGFESAAADAEYLQAIQVFGDKQQRKGDDEHRMKRARAVANLLDYATEFDPAFSYAYVFGANSIPITFADGSEHGTAEAIRLLKKGTARAGTNCTKADPTLPQVNCDWRVPFYLSYMLTSYEADFRGAAEAMADAAQRPGHPEYLEFLATRLAAVGGNVDKGLDLCRAMLLNAESEDKKKELSERCLLLEMELHIRKLEDAVSAFSELNGRLPVSLKELVEANVLAAVPNEPHGGAYELDPSSGEVRSTAGARLKLPDSVEREIAERRRLKTALQKEQ